MTNTTPTPALKTLAAELATLGHTTQRDAEARLFMAMHGSVEAVEALGIKIDRSGTEQDRCDALMKHRVGQG